MSFELDFFHFCLVLNISKYFLMIKFCVFGIFVNLFFFDTFFGMNYSFFFSLQLSVFSFVFGLDSIFVAILFGQKWLNDLLFFLFCIFLFKKKTLKTFQEKIQTIPLHYLENILKYLLMSFVREKTPLLIISFKTGFKKFASNSTA